MAHFEGSTVGGGKWNQIKQGVYSIIGGGRSNQIEGDYSVIGGGGTDEAVDPGSPGGTHNEIIGDFSGILGGKTNIIYSYFAAIGGGIRNQISSGDEPENTVSMFSFIGAGAENFIHGAHNGIMGGEFNRIVRLDDSHPMADTNVIGGGSHNWISGNTSFLGGGAKNEIEGHYGVIGGGRHNIAKSDYGLIGGGIDNEVLGSYGAIVNGKNNVVSSTANGYSIIGSGEDNNTGGNWVGILAGKNNFAQQDYTFIGGGEGHRIVAPGLFGSIPGGDHLQSQSYAQTVIGYYNRKVGNFIKGTSNKNLFLPANPLSNGNDRLFIIGNGDNEESRSNAFEVSYNGHATVFHNNGSGSTFSGQPAVYGSHYVDNTIYAWGGFTVVELPGGFFTVIMVGGDFGVGNITRVSAGKYIVTLNIIDPVTGNPKILTQGAITANIVDLSPTGDECHTGNIMVGPIGLLGPNQFTLRFAEDHYEGCIFKDVPIMFHVTGR